MKILLKLSLVFSALICTQATSTVYLQYNCVGTAYTCAGNRCCRGVAFLSPLPIYSARGTGNPLSTRVDVYASSDCVDYYSYSYGCYSNPSGRTLYAAMTESLVPAPPVRTCPNGSRCPSPYAQANYIMIEGKVHGGKAIKMRSIDIPDSIGYTDNSFRSYYIFRTNPAAKKVRHRHPNDIKLDYYKEHYDLLEIRDADDNLVEMSFNPKNNI